MLNSDKLLVTAYTPVIATIIIAFISIPIYDNAVKTNYQSLLIGKPATPLPELITSIISCTQRSQACHLSLMIIICIFLQPMLVLASLISSVLTFGWRAITALNRSLSIIHYHLPRCQSIEKALLGEPTNG